MVLEFIRSCPIHALHIIEYKCQLAIQFALKFCVCLKINNGFKVFHSENSTCFIGKLDIEGISPHDS